MNAAESSTNKRSPTLRRTTATLDSHTASSSSARRRRSRSPRPTLQTLIAQARAGVGESSQSASIKKRRSGTATMGHPLGSTSHTTTAQPSADDERGRKSKIPKSKAVARLVGDNSQASTSHAEHRLLRRERSKSRDSAKESQFPTDVGEESNAEITRLKRELEKLQKKEHEHKKAFKKQKQHLEEIRQQLVAKDESIRESRDELQKLQAKARKTEEALSTIETHSQCQICMDILSRPYTLSGCGHTLCMTCLQEWFRQAPAADYDRYDTEDPGYLVYRTKSCPVCRTNVSQRPVPAFLMKSIVGALAKMKVTTSPAPPRSPSPPADADPWEGLFPRNDEHEHDEWEGDGDESPGDFGDASDDDDDDEDEDGESDDAWFDDNFSYGSDSDAPPYDGNYIESQWDPPIFEASIVANEHYPLEDLDEDDMHVLARGGRLGMIHTWELRYSHAEGLTAYDERGNRYLLGWNIRLSGDDENGDGYMEWVMDDMQIHPERWRIEPLEDGTYDAHKLVPEDSVVEFSDTDSDDY